MNLLFRFEVEGSFNDSRQFGASEFAHQNQGGHMSQISKIAKAAAVAVVLTTTLSSTPAFAAASYPVKLKAAATGANEGAGKGSPTGSASANFIVSVSRGTFCYNITSKGLSGVNGVHIHKGGAGVDGPVVVPLNFRRFNKAGTACVKATPAVLSAIAMNPAAYYFNLHTPGFPAGAVRGQLKGMSGAIKTPVTSAPKTSAPATTAPSPKPGY
jgi:hypothetical protein